MDAENIIKEAQLTLLRDIRDLIHEVQSYEANASEDKKDASRVFYRAAGHEYTEHGYDTVSNGLGDATDALDRAKDRFGVVEEMLLKLINDIERESLSAKIHSR